MNSVGFHAKHFINIIAQKRIVFLLCTGINYMVHNANALAGGSVKGKTERGAAYERRKRIWETLTDCGLNAIFLKNFIGGVMIKRIMKGKFIQCGIIADISQRDTEKKTGNVSSDGSLAHGAHFFLYKMKLL